MREQGQQKQRAGPDDAAGTEVRTAGTAVFYFFSHGCAQRREQQTMEKKTILSQLLSQA